MKYLSVSAAISLLLCAIPAHADEIYGGLYLHAVDTPFTFDTQENGLDLQIGYRLDPVEELHFIGKPQPYVFGSINSAGDTNFAGFGLSWKLGEGPIYVRPGIGLVIHDAPSVRVNPNNGLRTDLGSQILFEPEIAIGVNLSERTSVEASWVHISNAQILDRDQNPGIDAIGLRVNYRF
ncbi:MAG: acyloxyacyl hydrolase [Erythrobacter sp.]